MGRNLKLFILNFVLLILANCGDVVPGLGPTPLWQCDDEDGLYQIEISESLSVYTLKIIGTDAESQTTETLFQDSVQRSTTSSLEIYGATDVDLQINVQPNIQGEYEGSLYTQKVGLQLSLSLNCTK